jgi:hypothetical protein
VLDDDTVRTWHRLYEVEGIVVATIDEVLCNQPHQLEPPIRDTEGHSGLLAMAHSG